jgi:flagellar hook-basal body complex protein FliE
MINTDLRIEGGSGEIAPHLKTTAPEKNDSEVSFKDVLKGLVNQVDSLQKDADASIEGLVTGKTDDIHDVTIKLEEAGIAFDLMMEVRNKLVDAYQQIIKIQS